MAYVQRRDRPRNQHICSICLQLCSYSSTFCNECEHWVHNDCDNIAKEKREQFEKLPIDHQYICRKCRCDEDGNLDFVKSMLRLNKAGIQGFKKLTSCVKREILFLDGPFNGASGTGNLAVDCVAQNLMEKYISSDKGIPAATSSLDHVLFRAVSLAVCAKDCLAFELRVRCCIEMVTYEQFYRYQKNHAKIVRCSPDYIDSCLDCALMDEGSSAWTMSALASVIKRPIMSVYPNINGPSDPAVQALNTTFMPREREVNCQLVRVLWTSESPEVQIGKWKPSHFVPLFDTQKKDQPPTKTQSRQHVSDPESGHDMDDCCDIMENDMSSALNEDEEMEPVPMEVAEGGFPIEFGRFMDVFEAYEKITTATEVHSDIPRGIKENVAYLVDNTHNMEHPERKNTFFDDCGVWDSKQGSVAKSHLLLDESGILCTLKLHSGVFKKLSKVGERQEWMVLDPQPDPDRVVICHRYYAFLKRCPEYKRRIIWFTMPPSQEMGKAVALVEYMGKFPGFMRQKHGNSKRGRGGKSNYVRTDPKLLDEIANQIRSGNNMKPMKMYKEIQKKMGPNCTLRDARQIRNLKYSVLKRVRKEQQLVGIKHEDTSFDLNSTGETETDATEDTTTALVTEPTHEAQSPIKVIIHQENRDIETTMEGLEDVTGMPHGSLVHLEEGQQAISFMDSDGNITNQTIIMVTDLKDLEGLTSGEIVVTEAI